MRNKVSKFWPGFALYSVTSSVRLIRFGLVTLLLSSLILCPAVKVFAADFADPAFQLRWQQVDKPVTDGLAQRSWVWGSMFSSGKKEVYKSAPGNQRLVQYFDKGRMEITNPGASRESQFYITNGLLVTELISGQIQTGDTEFAPNSAGSSQKVVAGDPENNAVALTYANFAPVASLNRDNRSPNEVGQLAIKTLSKDSRPGSNAGIGNYGIKYSYYDEQLGHNIPAGFWNFMNQQGPLFSNGSLSNGLVLDWQVTLGLPLTEAYWSRAVIGGQEKDVLVQMFERRTLTYTPSNAEAFQVEMGNVGQHYYTWRYSDLGKVALTDDLNDWSKVYRHTANLKFDTTNLEYFEGDTSRAYRSQTTNEEIVWKQAGMKSVAVEVYFWPNAPVVPLALFTSADEKSFEEVIPQISGGVGNWFHFTYTLTNLSDVNYLKIRWNNTEGQFWNPQIGRVVIFV